MPCPFVRRALACLLLAFPWTLPRLRIMVPVLGPAVLISVAVGVVYTMRFYVHVSDTAGADPMFHPVLPLEYAALLAVSVAAVRHAVRPMLTPAA